MTYLRLSLLPLLALVLVLPVSASAATPTFTLELRASSNGNLSIGHIRKVKKPTCALRATRTVMHSGERTRFIWSSKNAESMTGLTKYDTYAKKGTLDMAIGFPGIRDFQLEFAGPGGTTTCSRTIRVLPKKD